MLDLRLIREQPDAVARALADKGGGELIHAILERDAERRRLVKEADDLKALLKAAVADLLPEPMLGATKRGFVIPTGEWLRGELRPLVLRFLDPERLRRQGLFQPAIFERFVLPHLDRRADFGDQIWTLLMFQLWHLLHLEERLTAAPTFTWQDVAA